MGNAPRDRKVVLLEARCKPGFFFIMGRSPRINCPLVVTVLNLDRNVP